MTAWPTHWLDRRAETDMLDCIGDVHGCADELAELLTVLGYTVRWGGTTETRRAHIVAPPGRKAVLLGDLVDRGPNIPDALRLAMALVNDGAGYCVVGNHDYLLVENICARSTRHAAVVASSLRALLIEPAAFTRSVVDFLMRLPSYIWFDGLVVSHAGLPADMIGLSTAAAYDCATRREPPLGARRQYDTPTHWADTYAVPIAQVYGHYRVDMPVWTNATMCLDTACVYGGSLTALRWPEREIVSVRAHAAYAISRITGRATPMGTAHYVSE